MQNIIFLMKLFATFYKTINSLKLIVLIQFLFNCINPIEKDNSYDLKMSADLGKVMLQTQNDIK